ncbi:hypothetical protein ONZ51_g2195 [Trametes cubensis]|uniref:Uncharacterized protein n=1 Tax=Trametes cubensis TaxID=1111947 RepID=A0AAD7U0K1_9APHY|nr:hypothetical protein ONZ51_g2195 [Trametes cubensis]
MPTTLTQDEDPSPAMVSPDAVHLPDRAREQAAECAREGRGRVEEREALLRLFESDSHRADGGELKGESSKLIPCNSYYYRAGSRCAQLTLA